jgi:hypothetical protein
MFSAIKGSCWPKEVALELALVFIEEVGRPITTKVEEVMEGGTLELLEE